MKFYLKLEKRSNRILFAMLIGIIFACGSFLMQQTAKQIDYDHINPSSLKYEATCDVDTVYNGVNQVKIAGYSTIQGIDSTDTQITIVAVPKNGDPYSGYRLPGYQHEYPTLTNIYGGGQEYSLSGVEANCYVAQIPAGVYNIGILTQVKDGGLAYKITDQTFENGVYKDLLDKLFILFSWIVYALFAYLCLELLFAKKTAAADALPEEGKSPGKHSALSILNIIFAAVFFWIFLNVTFSNITPYANIETYKGVCSVWSAFLIFIIMYSIWNGLDVSKKPSARTKLFIALGCIAFFAFQIAVCFSISGQIRSFDSTQIASSALSYIQYGSVTLRANYFVLNPNNYFMLFTDVGLYKMVGGSEFYFQQLTYVINIIFLDVAIALSYFCIKQLAGPRTAVVMLLPLCLLIGLNPMMIMFYSDILTMVIPVLVFFMYLKLRKSSNVLLKIVLLILMALAAYIGYQFKITSIIILIAIPIIELIYHIRQWKRVVAVLLSCALVFGILFTLDQKTKEYTDTAPLLGINFDENPNLEASSAWHYIMMGLSYPYGTFSQEDWDFSLTRVKATRIAEIKEVINRRLESYGPAGYLMFLNNKAIYAFGDATFGVGGDPNGDYAYNMPENMVSKLLQDVFGTSGKWFPLFAYTLQGIWVLCLFFIVCPLFFKNRKKVDLDISILRLSLAGVLVYLLVSENNTRQLVNQLPLVMILAAFSLQPVIRGFKNIAEKVYIKIKKQDL